SSRGAKKSSESRNGDWSADVTNNSSPVVLPLCCEDTLRQMSDWSFIHAQSWLHTSLLIRMTRLLVGVTITIMPTRQCLPSTLIHTGEPLWPWQASAVISMIGRDSYTPDNFPVER